MTVDLSGRGELIMTYPRRAEARLVFAQDIRGHLLIVDDASGRIVAELNADGAQQYLAVAAGRYRIQLRRGSTFRTGLVRVPAGARQVRLSNLQSQQALAVMRKGAAFDPHPWTMSAGGGLGRSAVDGFDPVPFAALGLDWRWRPRLRLAIRGFLGHQTSTGSPWRISQLEWGAMAGLDWSFVQAARWDGRVGFRAGVIGAVQSGERTDAARLIAANVRGVPRDLNNSGWGPDFTLPLLVDFYPWRQFGLRVVAAPSLHWLRVAEDTSARWGFSAEVAVVIRL